MNNKVTFASIVKQEIASETDFSLPRKKALLCAYLRINGVLSFKNKSTNVRLKTSNSKVAKYIYKNLKSIFPEDEIELSFGKNRTQKTTYTILINHAESLLNALNVDYLEGKIPKEIVYNDETISGYLAGAFLACGSINSPKTSNYHLEFSIYGESFAKWTLKLFSKYKKIELTPKLIKRRDKHVIYMKRSDQISNFLIMAGAPESCMDLEGERVRRDYVNSENRLNNFEVANMEKAYAVGKRQAREIKYIDDHLGIFNLHNPKKEALCYIRMENKEASLEELASLLSEETGLRITKSNVNHMLRSLHDLYNKLQEVKKR